MHGRTSVWVSTAMHWCMIMSGCIMDYAWVYIYRGQYCHALVYDYEWVHNGLCMGVHLSGSVWTLHRCMTMSGCIMDYAWVYHTVCLRGPELPCTGA